MSDVNKVILVGRLGSNPELTTTINGRMRCQMSVATGHVFKDSQGARQKQTTWHKVVCWGRLAELCNTFLAKGRQVYVEGRLESSKFTDKQGVERTVSKVVAREVLFLESKREGQDSGTRENSMDYGPLEDTGEEALAF